MSPGTLKTLAASVGEALPTFLIEYIEAALTVTLNTLAVHTSSSIENYSKSANLDTISRTKGFLGNPQLEKSKFPNAIRI